MSKAFIALALLIILGGGYYWYAKQQVVKSDAQQVTAERSDRSQDKLDMSAACEGALAYMTFPDSNAAHTFVEECKAGGHPEVIERYKKDRNPDGAAL